MLRILDWFHGLLANPKATSEIPPPSRLLNPGLSPAYDPAGAAASLDTLEEGLFCWLLNVGPSVLTTPDRHSDAILAELAARVEADQLEELPRQPLTLPMLMRTMSDEDGGRDQLVKIILGDPALTDQLLQVANSPFFRKGEQNIESLDQAVFLMGHDGIRSVVSASIMRPVLAARNSSEGRFAQRVWRWGMACARSAESIARLQGGDASAHFLLGLLPALSYMTLRRELTRLYQIRHTGQALPPGLLYAALRQFDWATAQLLAREWHLPPRYHASLLAAERPAPEQRATPLNDGIILATREILHHARQPNIPEDELRQILLLEAGQFDQVRGPIASMLQKGVSPTRPVRGRAAP